MSFFEINWFKRMAFSLFMKFNPNNDRLYKSINSYGNFENVEYVKNYDGDTITVNIKSLHPLIGKNINIRVSGIDTPEMKGGCEKSKALAREAQQVVEKLLINAKKIDLVNCTRGKYFRICADVYADNINIASLLIVKGLAVQYDGGKKTHNWCKQ